MTIGDETLGQRHIVNQDLLLIPGGCKSILQPLDISINKPFKGYIRQCWCRYMIEETEKGHSPIRHLPKISPVDWILNAQKKIESKKEIIQKSFIVAGITCNPNYLVRMEYCRREGKMLLYT